MGGLFKDHGKSAGDRLISRVFRSLPVPSQHLLVLLFGTFRMIADSADSYNTKMSPNAIAISVAPSLFHSCIHDGRHVSFTLFEWFQNEEHEEKGVCLD